MIYKIKPIENSILLGALSILFLSSAYIMQFGFDMQPCILCIYQRIPYLLLILFSILAMALRHNDRIVTFFLSLSTLILFIGSAIAFYHAGVEYGFFEGLSSCATKSPMVDNIEKLKNFLLQQKAMDCSKPQFVFLLSLAGWNFIISLSLGIFTLVTILRSK
jgi:disulfide bond formation protein DsbB